MEKRISRLVGLLSLALILTGCEIRQQQPAPVEQTTPPVTAPTQPEPPVPTTPPPSVPQPPKFQTINWDASVSPLIAQMLHASGAAPGSVLMVAGVRNNTNGSIQSGKVTGAVNNALASQTQFQLVPADQLQSARQTLGLSQEDSLTTRSKAIGIARAVSAQDVLYTTVSGDVKSPKVQMQLMTVQTGEIIWSGSGVAQF